MNNTNVSKEMEKLLLSLKEKQITPKLLLHSCCAPCSSYCLEYLTPYFDIVDFFYNPNITEEKEYRYRSDELKRLIESMEKVNDITFLEGNYEPECYLNCVKGFESCPERGKRCSICFALRLDEAAKKCKEIGADYFTTTLTISPLKNAEVINDIGKRAGEKYGVTYLPSDFKKKNGYKRSIELSKEYDLYRQNYCGCIFSKGENADE